MFDANVLSAIAAVAKSHKLDLAALLAVVEIESDGKSLEGDGKTPSFLFEKHIFYKQLAALAPARLHEAVALGLAYPSWNPATEYKNEATSAMRLSLLEKAKAINTEAALRSASWGVGQTMGFLCHELGFTDAVHMVDFMVQGGVPAQVECMVREIERSKLGDKLNIHDWAAFAHGYNGAGYRRNAYDTKLAAAYGRWKPRVAAIAAPTVAEPPATNAVSETKAAMAVSPPQIIYAPVHPKPAAPAGLWATVRSWF